MEVDKMRILQKEEAKKVDVDFVYRNGNAVAIVDINFNKKFEILQKK